MPNLRSSLTYRFAFIFALSLLFLGGCGGSSGSDRTIETESLKDTTPPVITLNGDNELTLYQGEAYAELGAAALDDVDGEISVTTSGEVATSQIGEYTISYLATDSSGNSSTLVRTIKVIALPDTRKPTIELAGAAILTLIYLVFSAQMKSLEGII